MKKTGDLRIRLLPWFIAVIKKAPVVLATLHTGRWVTMSSLNQYWLFFLQTLRRRKSVGAVVPSTRHLGWEMMAHIEPGRPMDVLEVGPGTGVFTKLLIERLTASDRLTVVEINPIFCKMLRERIAVWEQEPDTPQIALIEGDFLTFKHHASFDLIISSLPLNNFSASTAEAFVDQFRRVLKPDGMLSFYEYTGLRLLRHFFSGTGEVSFEATHKAELAPYIVSKERVMRNLPPATVSHVCFSGK